MSAKTTAEVKRYLSTERSRKYRAKIRLDPKRHENYRKRERERDIGYTLKRFYRRNIVSIIEEEKNIRVVANLWDLKICPLHLEECIDIRDDV